MMLAMGCIQSLQCNKGNCPTGITSQQPRLIKGLDVDDKRQRVANFHLETIKSTAEIIAAAGLSSTQELNRKYIFRRISQTQISHYQGIYPTLQTGSLLSPPFPYDYADDIKWANSEMFNNPPCKVN